MRPNDVSAILAQLRTMWPGDLEPEAQAIWASKLAEFNDNDPSVKDAMDACLEVCEFRPTWSEFSKAYRAARAAEYRLTHETHHRELPVPYTGPNPATRIKEMLANTKARARPKLSLTAGDAVRVERLHGTGTFVKMSPDHEWCIVRHGISDHWIHPARITPVEQ